MTRRDFVQPMPASLPPIPERPSRTGATPSSDAATAEGVDQQAARWWLHYREGELSPGSGALAQDFGDWLLADPRHAAAWHATLQTAQALDDLPVAAVQSLRAEARATTQAPVRPEPPASHLPAGARRSRRRNWLTQTSLATVAFVLTGSAAWWTVDQYRQQPLFSQTHATQRGQLLELPLPDGSRIVLDTATQLRVQFYRDRREVQLLQGQALFSVAADARRPFHVDAATTRVSVLGTRFQVRHVGQGVGVAVEEGRVQVQRLAPGQGVVPGAGVAAASVVLGAWQAVRADAGGVFSDVEPVARQAVAAWRSGRLDFDDVPLADALAEFARYADTGLSVRDPHVAALRVTGSFDVAKLQSFAQALPQVLPVRLLRHDGMTEVVAR